MAVILRPKQWRTQPSGAVEINWSNGLLERNKTSEVLVGSAYGCGLVTGAQYSPSAFLLGRGPGGIGYTFASAGSDYVEIASDADNVLDLSTCTLIYLRSLTSTSYASNSQHGYNAGGFDRAAIHLPYSNGNVYWDYGDATEGSGRMVVTSPSFAVGALDLWVATAGLRGRELWRNGVRIGNNTGAIQPRTTTTQPWRLGAGNANGSNPETIYLFALCRDEWSPGRIVEFSRAPYAIFKRNPQRIYFTTGAASTVFIPIVGRGPGMSLADTGGGLAGAAQ